jgi:purine nucleosidase
MTQSSPVPLILDVDTGLDDALALALACASPDAELVAVTTVAGNVSLDLATRNTLAVLDWIGAHDVSVHSGANHPLVRVHHDAAHVHGDNGLGGAELPPSQRATGSDRGPAAIIRMARARPNELTLVCLGPLTNLAIALNVDPELPSLLRQVVVMGGAYRVPGNLTKFAEFNIFCDPEAADQVFSTPFPDLVAVGLDVTHQTRITSDLWRASETLDHPPAQLVRQVFASAFSSGEKLGFYIHDALAVAVALDPTLISTESWEVRVLGGRDERGHTTLWRPSPVNVARTVDAQRFLDYFCACLGLPKEDASTEVLRTI